MIGKIISNDTNRVPSKNATTRTHNVNLSFEIGTSHIYPTDTNKILLEDVNDGIEARVQNDTNKTVIEGTKDGVEACAQNDDRNGK